MKFIEAVADKPISFYAFEILYWCGVRMGELLARTPADLTKEEYMKFIEAVADKPISFYAFEILYWCGVRMGELLARTPADFDIQACTIRINKSYQRLEGKDIITDPKTVKSNRMITMPEFLSEELESYIGMLYGLNENDRIFLISKSYLHHEMDRGVKLSGVKRILIHDLRHSHVSLLVNMGYSAVAIGERVGHESVEISYRYAHLWWQLEKG